MTRSVRSRSPARELLDEQDVSDGLVWVSLTCARTTVRAPLRGKGYSIMRKRSLLLAAGACLAVLSLTTTSAFADPVPATPDRSLAGVGSDTTQDVMNGFGNGVTFSNPAFPTGIVDGSNNRVLASFDAVPQPSNINTHPSKAACNNISRPNGSGAGITALHLDTAGCIQFARSSSNDSQDSSRNGFGLTYIPFATDVLTYVTASQTGVPSNLSLATLTTLYSRNAGTTGCGVRRPLLPQPNSGTRAAWLKLLGLTEATKGDCVKDTVNGTLLEEHDGRPITDGQMIFPYSVAKWVTQTTQPAVPDIHGNTVLRGIDNASPFDAAAHPGVRTLYNVVRTTDLGTDPIRSTFVDQRSNTPAGPNAQICLHPEVMKAYGFQLAPNCGSTAIHTNG